MILTACCNAVFRPFAKPKTILVMKLTTMLLLVGCLQVSATAFAQKVSLNVENASLKKVFKDIRKQTGYLFFYNTQLLEKAHPVSISARDREIKDVLDECFRDQPLTYNIVNKTIVISALPAAEPPPAAQPDSTPLIRVNGKVIDAQNNTALSGANITVRGQDIGQAAGQDPRERACGRKARGGPSH